MPLPSCDGWVQSCRGERRGAAVGREGGRGGLAGAKETYLAAVDALRPSGMRLQVLVREELPAAEAAGEVDDRCIRGGGRVGHALLAVGRGGEGGEVVRLEETGIKEMRLARDA